MLRIVVFDLVVGGWTYAWLRWIFSPNAGASIEDLIDEPANPVLCWTQQPAPSPKGTA